MTNSFIYALDFDGVLCDSAVETGMTGWKAATKLWNDMPESVPPDLIERFRNVRPIIETGYEAILAMRLLFLGESTDAVFSHFGEKANGLINEASVSIDDLKNLFGETRDLWIARDLDDWVDRNPLFEGVATKLQKLWQLCPWYVVTTKQERFVKQILQANAIELADERIFGLDRKLSKVDVLASLLESHPGKTIHFVEDRLPTLLNVLKQDRLSSVQLSFALWGYNTAEDKALAEQQPFTSIHLNDFLAF
ncbi:MAG: HAD family hydrolase [Methylococcaceae bacterium]|nr:HAD family hydrolase [Methylococcaceae bacterium]